MLASDSGSQLPSANDGQSLLSHSHIAMHGLPSSTSTAEAAHQPAALTSASTAAARCQGHAAATAVTGYIRNMLQSLLWCLTSMPWPSQACCWSSHYMQTQTYCFTCCSSHGRCSCLSWKDISAKNIICCPGSCASSCQSRPCQTAVVGSLCRPLHNAVTTAIVLVSHVAQHILKRMP